MKMKIQVLDINGEKKAAQDIKILKDDASEHMLYITDKYQAAYQRQGTASVKTRSTIRGGGAKPYRQKGTGRARRGTNRTPLRRGGAVIFGPQPRDFSFKLNSKLIRNAIATVISESKKKIAIVNFAKEENIKTKNLVKFLEKDGLKKEQKASFILDNDEIVTYKACRNIENISVMNMNFMPLRILLNSDKLYISIDAMKKLEGILNR